VFLWTHAHADVESSTIELWCHCPEFLNGIWGVGAVNKVPVPWGEATLPVMRGLGAGSHG
jgi:hypothetical protein